MTIIGLKELSQNAGKIADRVAKGERFTVVKRSRPVFDIVSHDPKAEHEELREWTRKTIEKYRPAFEELAKK